MDITLTLQQLINGLALGGTYTIFALGYTLVFSILGIIKFSHAAVFTLGAYYTYLFMGLKFGFNGVMANYEFPIDFPFPIALLLSAIAGGLTSVLIERTVLKPLRDRGADSLLTLVASLGVATLLVNLIQYLVGAEAISYPPLPSTLGIAATSIIELGFDKPLIIRNSQLMTLVVSVVILVLLTVFINNTRMGKALQAVAEDPVTSSLLGINTDRLIFITFFLAGFIAAIAGTMVGYSSGITGPYFGIAFGLKGLAVIVLGGLGSIPGTILGGMIIGLSEAFVPSELIGYKDAIAFAILFGVLLTRPRGLLGRVLIQKV
jgi:branched-chain amino acid transport system permease protein